MNLLKNKIFNQVLLFIFATAFVFFVYETLMDPQSIFLNLLFVAVALVGFFKTLNDLKKNNVKQSPE